MKSTDIRSKFLEFFKNKGHVIVPGSSLIPVNDPTLLFTNAGMNQFKDVFLGREKKPYLKATTAQRCVRAGGKHNDLENVGYTARHHTFFEMLGNFSFGDYFKREAIRFAWEFLTKHLNFPEEKLWVTVHKNDHEAEEIWLKEMKVSSKRFSRLGDHENFWTMGDTGPCGPCSEIFYDHGPCVAGDPPGGVNDDGDRYVEIWNMVFMQYSRDANGVMHPLPNPSIDTGMGLERVTAAVQGVHSNYEIDSFQHILKVAGKLLGGVPSTDNSLRVIADHIRSCAFLIADGVMPSNEGRGYTLRRIIRRACRHGHKLGENKTFFYKLVPVLIEAMGDVADPVKGQQQQVERVLKQEEEQFNKTLDKGMRLLEADIASLTGKEISGNTIFTLYDTYGFPVDLTNDIARERGLSLDFSRYETLMDAQRERARSSGSFGIDYNKEIVLEGKTVFTGYEKLQNQASVMGLFVGGKPVESIEAADTKAVVIFDQTPFYAESGGQVGDKGKVIFGSGSFVVNDTQKSGAHHLHSGILKAGKLSKGDTVKLSVNEDSRPQTAANHSATHLLHAALRKVLGEHVQQKGSLVDSKHLRFDFAHFEPITQKQIIDIQDLVNEQIRNNTQVDTQLMDIESARARGAVALFGEKYDEIVRVLTMGKSQFSVELCGGTHVRRTGDIGTFIILAESGIASGIRRIEALTGEGSQHWINAQRLRLKQVADAVKGSSDNVLDKVLQLSDKNRQLEKRLQQLQQKLASVAGDDLQSKAVNIHGVKVLAVRLEADDTKSLRDIIDQLKNKLGSGILFLAVEQEGKIAMAAGVTKNLTDKVHAGDLLKFVANQVNGKGGGRSDFAQGGGNNVAALSGAIDSVAAWVETKLV